MDTSRYEHDKNKNAVLMGFNLLTGENSFTMPCGYVYIILK